MSDNLQETQKSITRLFEENKITRKDIKNLRNSHIEIYDRLEIIEEEQSQMNQKFDQMLEQMKADSAQARKDSKSFHLQIVKQNEKMAKLEIITQQNQKELQASRQEIKANQQEIRVNQENIAVSIQALKLAMDDLLAMRRDQSKLIDHLFGEK